MRLCRSRVWRLRPGDDAGAALLISLMTILVATSLSIAVLGSVVSQLGPAQFGMKNTRTAHAAEAGLDTALGVIRTALVTDPADNTRTVGDRRLLPCTAGTRAGTLNGTVAGSPGNLRYTVTLTYFNQDPAGYDTAWRAANALPCSASGGPSSTPLFAAVSSTGNGIGVGAAAGDVASRTLQVVYELNVTNANLLGGLIHNLYDGNPATRDLCLDAGSATPVNGAPVLVQACSPGAASQTFSWRSDYSLVLSSTQSTSGSDGMCIQSTPVTGPDYAFMQQCADTYTQKWGYSDEGQFALHPLYNPPSSTDASRSCLYIVTDNTPGSRVAASPGQCVFDATSRTVTWRPDSRVGAGNAGSQADPIVNVPMQWVNFEEFGRCFDVTAWVFDYPFMIAYPCKQEPAGYVGWNETLVWAGAGANGHLYTVSTGANQSFAQAAASGNSRKCALAPTVNGGRVLLTVCDTANPRHTWVVNRATGVYATAYTVVDSYGRCLSLGAPGATSGGLSEWSTIVAETCNGSTRQKWNAPAWIGLSSIADTRETVD